MKKNQKTDNGQRTTDKIKNKSVDHEETEQEQVYITHAHLAKLCGFSVSTLYRKFKEYQIENDGKLISPKLRDEILIKLEIK